MIQRKFTKKDWIRYYTPNTKMDLLIGFTKTGCAITQNIRNGHFFISSSPNSIGKPLGYNKLEKYLVERVK